MSEIARERYQTGNRCAVFSRGEGRRRLGFGQVAGKHPDMQTTDMNQNTGNRPLHGIGDAEPLELVDGAHTYDVSLSMLRLADQAAAEEINAGEVDIEIVDQFNGQRVKTAEGCKLVGARLPVQANQPVVRNISFNSLRIK